MRSVRLYSIFLLVLPVCWGRDMAPMSHNYKDSDVVGEYTAKSLRNAYQRAPKKVKRIVEILKHPESANAKEKRFRLFLGEPGTSKTTMAHAIGVEAEWGVEPFTPADFQTKDRNESADSLNEMFDDMKDKKENTLIIIDEVDGLLEHANDKSNDNGASSKALWKIMDRIRVYPHLFMLLLSNDVSLAPRQFKFRSIPNVIRFNMMDKVGDMYQSLIGHVQDVGCTLGTDMTLEAMEELFKGYRCSERDFDALATIAYEKQYARGNGKVIGKELVKKCRDKISSLENAPDIDTAKKIESDYDQRERHFKRTYSQNAKHHSMSYEQAQVLHNEADQVTYMMHALQIAEDIIKSREAMPLKSMSSSGANQLIDVQPEPIRAFFNDKPYAHWVSHVDQLFKLPLP